MKKDNKISKPNSASERETRVLLEDIRQQVQIVAKGHGAIIRKLEEHDKKFEEHDKRFEEQDKKLGEISGTVQRIDFKVNKIEQELDTVKNAVMDISRETKGLGNRVTKLEEKILA